VGRTPRHADGRVPLATARRHDVYPRHGFTTGRHHGSGYRPPHRHPRHLPPRRHYHRHDYFDRFGFSLTFTFGSGPYFGFSYYYPFHHHGHGLDYAFFYADPVCFAYVPFGFYVDRRPVYVTRYEYVVVERPSPDPGTIVESEEPPPEPEEEAKVAEPLPAAGSPTTEKYLREASEHFMKAEYFEAAELFRTAALSADNAAGPLFALGQALIAMKVDDYAARVIRRAVLLDPRIVREPGDIVGVYESPKEFDRVLKALGVRAAQTRYDSDSRFLLAVQHYFSGDPVCIDEFDSLASVLTGDAAVALFKEAAHARYDPEDLPPIVK
jgi:hypothetical protein